MLARVLREIPKLTDAVVGADVHGEPTYDVTSTGAADAVREAGTSAKRTARQARKVPGVARAEGQVKGAVASEQDLAIARYDALTAEEIIGRLAEPLAGRPRQGRRLRAQAPEALDRPRPHRLAPGRRAVARVRRAHGRRGPRRARRGRRRPHQGGARLRARAQEPRRRPQGRRAPGRRRLAARGWRGAAPGAAPQPACDARSRLPAGPVLTGSRSSRLARLRSDVLSRSPTMILRVDRLQTELPPPSDPDPVGAAAVQELLGGKFGEMSTFMNYTYQSFNFRNRQGARPFYDLLASIAAEEFGHIELVSAAINTMLTGAAEGEPGKAGALDAVQGRAQPAALHRRRRGRARPGLQRQALERRLRLLLGRPRRGPHAQLLPRDRGAQQQAQGLRDGRAPGGPRADRLPARARRRAPGRLRAGPGEPHRSRPHEALPDARGSRPRRSPSASRTSSAAST